MATLEQIARVSFVKGSSDEKRDIVDHIAIREVIHEFGEGASCVGLEIAEFGDEFVGGFLCEGGR